MNSVKVLNKFKAPGNKPQGLSSQEIGLWMILVEKGEKRLYGIPVLDALETGSAKSFIAVKLRDENGQGITDAEPVSVASLSSNSLPSWWNYSGTIYIGFSDKKIRTYNPDMTLKKAFGDTWFYTTSQVPDGLYFDGTLYYCSASADAVFGINTSTGVETRQKVTVGGSDFDVISRRLAVNGVTTDNTGLGYTTRRYFQDSPGVPFAPTAIAQNFLCSSSLNKISKRETSIGKNFINTLLSATPTWTNEQTTPAPAVGIAEVTDYSVPEGYVVYLSGNDGKVYKVRFEDKAVTSGTTASQAFRKTVTSSGTTYGQLSTAVHGREQGVSSSTIFRQYFNLVFTGTFLEAFFVLKESFGKYRDRWNGNQFVREFSQDSFAPSTFNICSFDNTWTAEQKFNNPVLSAGIASYPYDGPGANFLSEASPTLIKVDVTSIVPSSNFWYTGRYGNEAQSLGVDSVPNPSPIPLNYVSVVSHTAAPEFGYWTFLTDGGSLTVLKQFTGKGGQRGMHIGHKIPYIKIVGQDIDGYLKKSGKTYAEAVASTPAVTINKGTGSKLVGTRLTGGLYEIYRSYVTFATKFIDFTPSAIHLFLKTATLTVTDMELLVYSIPKFTALTNEQWQDGTLLVRKQVCAYHSIYLPVTTDLSNGIYVELRGSQEGTNGYIQNDLVTITAYELRIFYDKATT